MGMEMQMKWISIKDRVPTVTECVEDNGWFLVIRTGFGRPDMSRYDGHDPEHSYDHGWKYVWDVALTHWMPLPKRPDAAESRVVSE